MNFASLTFSPRRTSGAMERKLSFAFTLLLSLSANDAQLFNKFVKTWAADSQVCRRAGQVPFVAGERGRHHFSFHGFTGFAETLVFMLREGCESEILRRDSAVFGHDDCSLNSVLKFPDVAGPAMRFQSRQ